VSLENNNTSYVGIVFYGLLKNMLFIILCNKNNDSISIFSKRALISIAIAVFKSLQLSSVMHTADKNEKDFLIIEDM
jgi:hypothetical protein